MKASKLKIILTAIGFFALSATFAQVDSSKSTITTANTDSVSVSSQANPQASPMATDSAVTIDNSTINDVTVSTSDSTAAEYKAAKKLKKAEKKQARADKKQARADKKQAKADKKLADPNNPGQ